MKYGISNIIDLNISSSAKGVWTTLGNDSQYSPLYTTIAHEMGHVYENYALGVTSQADTRFGPDSTTAEIFGTHVENIVRAESGLPLRTNYGSTCIGSACIPNTDGRLIDNAGGSIYYNSNGGQISPTPSVRSVLSVNSTILQNRYNYLINAALYNLPKMKKIVLLFSIMLFSSCNSQEKISLIQMNENLLKDKNSLTYRDSATIKIITEGYKIFRLLGAKSCDVNPDKKYSQIYIEDGFHDEEGFYNGLIIVDNKNICEVTTSPYKLCKDSLSYTKVKEKDTTYGEIVFYTKKFSIEDLKNKYPDEYFRYELVTQSKVNSFEKCLAIDRYTPKSVVYTRNYYFAGKGIKTYHSPIKYNDIKNGIEGLPYFQEDKKKEFIECINKLDILKIHNSSNFKASSVSD